MRLVRALFCSAAVLLMLGGIALARPLVKLHFSGAAVQHEDGKTTFRPVEGLTLHAGQVVRYSIDATNSGDQSALNFSTVGPVPAHMEYVTGSARASAPARIEYSIDGKTWSARPMLIVKTATGTQRKAAAPSTYVSVRFTSLKPIAPKGTFHYSYEVTVK